MNLASWLDGEFYSTGCCFPLSGEGHYLLAKGGKWQSTDGHPLRIQIRDFYTQETKYYLPGKYLFTTLKELRAELPIPDLETGPMEEHRYDHLFQQDFMAFQQSLPQLSKAVLMSRSEFKIQNVLELKKMALAKAIHSHIGEAYGFWFEDYAMIGTTPEILYEIQNEIIRTLALAGTTLKDQIDELLNSPKLRKEHELVIKNILEDLQPFCEELQRFETCPAFFGKLAHLKTMIEGKLRPHVVTDQLIKALSPTAALGGYPRELARDFLVNGHYAGSFPHRYHGSIFAVKTDSFERAIVMIRNIQLVHDRLIIEAGAGVVEASEAETELREIHQKIAVIRELLL
jgi:isochorismate synthase EntC